MRLHQMGALLTSLLAVGACALEVGDLPEEDIRTQTQEIINGTPVNSNGNAVALYLKANAGTCQEGSITYSHPAMWWPRPCSGFVIRKDGNTNYILTARHCVTVDGTVNGALLPMPPQDQPSPDLKVTSAIAPGTLNTVENHTARTLSVTEDPPSYTVSARILYAGAPSGSGDYGEDLAIVRAVGNLTPTTAPVRRAIFATTQHSNALLNRSLQTWGYGRSVLGNCLGHNTGGAGVLRKAGAFVVTSANEKTVTTTGVNSSDQAITFGDSGGVLNLSHDNSGWFSIVGVNSSSQVGAGGTNLFPWLLSKMSYAFLTERGKLDTAAVVGSHYPSVETLQSNFGGSAPGTRISYNFSTSRISLNGRCFQDMGNGANVLLKACSTANSQKWSIIVATEATGGNEVRATYSGNCLHRADTGASTPLTTTPCPSARKWAFLMDNDMN